MLIKWKKVNQVHDNIVAESEFGIYSITIHKIERLDQGHDDFYYKIMSEDLGEILGTMWPSMQMAIDDVEWFLKRRLLRWLFNFNQ